MKVSVIIPAYNEERLLGETLVRVRTAMMAFSDRGWESELIVCDNNSSDATAEVALAAGATVVFEPHNQIARARNAGAAAATGNWVVFVDADSRPSKDLFAAAGDEMASGNCLAGGSTLRMETDSRLANLGMRKWNFISTSLRYMAGSFIFCEAAAFREIGGFDERLFAGEEIDLSRRLKRLARRRKHRIVILTAHPMWTSPRKLSLYSPGEYLRFMLVAVLTLGRSVRRRDGCAIWYDGRR